MISYNSVTGTVRESTPSSLMLFNNCAHAVATMETQRTSCYTIGGTVTFVYLSCPVRIATALKESKLTSSHNMGDIQRDWLLWREVGIRF